MIRHQPIPLALFGIAGKEHGELAVLETNDYGVVIFAEVIDGIRREDDETDVINGDRVWSRELDGDVMALVFKKGMTQLGLGMMLGLGLGVVISRALASVSVHVEPGDPVVYGAVVLTFVAAGLLACAVPARRATQIDLVDSLKAN